jgi:hypothetical protein
MMSAPLERSDGRLLVEFPIRPGATDVARLNTDELYRRSTEAVSKAMEHIKAMAQQVKDAVVALPESHRPSEVQVRFGLKLDMEAGAMIAKAGGEASFDVRVTWRGDGPVRRTAPQG